MHSFMKSINVSSVDFVFLDIYCLVHYELTWLQVVSQLAVPLLFFQGISKKLVEVTMVDSYSTRIDVSFCRSAWFRLFCNLQGRPTPYWGVGLNTSLASSVHLYNALFLTSISFEPNNLYFKLFLVWSTHIISHLW